MTVHACGRRAAALAALLSVALLAAVPPAHAATGAADIRGVCTGPNEALARNATWVEKDPAVDAETLAKHGRPDYAYHSAVDLQPAAGPDAGGRIVPAHVGEGHAFAQADSPFNTANLKYRAEMQILHWVSAPCTQDDDYAYSVFVRCVFGTAGNTCNAIYDAYVALQVDSGGGFGAPWGYSHRRNNSGRLNCTANGGPHALPDEVGDVRTYIWMDVVFTDPSPDIPATARKSTSRHMWTSQFGHVYGNGPCAPGWCSTTGPPASEPTQAWSSCTA